METEDYGRDTLIGNYIRRCNAAGAPLNETQINALERAIISSSGVMDPEKRVRESENIPFALSELKKRAEALGHDQKRATRVYHALKVLRGTHKGYITDAELLRLYNSFGELKPHQVTERCYELHGRTFGFGPDSYIFLQDYVKARELI